MNYRWQFNYLKYAFFIWIYKIEVLHRRGHGAHSNFSEDFSRKEGLKYEGRKGLIYKKAKLDYISWDTVSCWY